jgi:hypothetical protein
MTVPLCSPDMPLICAVDLSHRLGLVVQFKGPAPLPHTLGVCRRRMLRLCAKVELPKEEYREAGFGKEPIWSGGGRRF